MGNKHHAQSPLLGRPRERGTQGRKIKSRAPKTIPFARARKSVRYDKPTSNSTANERTLSDHHRNETVFDDSTDEEGMEEVDVEEEEEDSKERVELIFTRSNGVAETRARKSALTAQLLQHPNAIPGSQWKRYSSHRSPSCPSSNRSDTDDQKDTTLHDRELERLFATCAQQLPETNGQFGERFVPRKWLGSVGADQPTRQLRLEATSDSQESKDHDYMDEWNTIRIW